MAFTLGSLFLLCGISGLLTGAWSAKIVPVKGNSCPKGWTQLDCFCYIYEPETRTFADAESVCNILGGNLVSIHNDLENAFVLELIRAADDTTSEAWIGLNDAVLNTDFMWTDGSDVDFTIFDGGAADDDGNCVEMETSDGEWDDVDCTTELSYVCIREASLH
ncbi:galactose-specific lectin nattectin [Syngnathus scovelli]|uniref:galactose-specific lectin nattectin n=1 Tax=Syngnathus scovelli TaxID=161590 RepID=UPI00210F852B|nr:galactose-specific lectin nattectin [Syngnathus scovelli]XP_049608619.1 galactose-specific lectin nattectin [Syngnathus scovelli]XP_049608620.1 galactose-specific lectin nattectin [Syngnathus scovelli]